MNGRFKRISGADFLELVLGCHSAFRPDRAAVLIFHLEHTIMLGLLCHQPSDAEVLQGSYDRERREWVHGPAGVSLSTWRLVNREFESAGILDVAKKSGETLEYTPHLDAIRAAIQAWKNRPATRGRGMGGN